MKETAGTLLLLNYAEAVARLLKVKAVTAKAFIYSSTPFFVFSKASQERIHTECLMCVLYHFIISFLKISEYY